jgi:hypothetical protein
MAGSGESNFVAPLPARFTADEGAGSRDRAPHDRSAAKFVDWRVIGTGCFSRSTSCRRTPWRLRAVETLVRCSTPTHTDMSDVWTVWHGNTERTSANRHGGVGISLTNGSAHCDTIDSCQTACNGE